MEQEASSIDSDFSALKWALGCAFACYLEGKRVMTAQERANKLGEVAPVIMSFLAFVIVLVVVATGWERHSTDEGAAAHLFQLLIVGQAPFVLMFLLTAKWSNLVKVVKPFAIQVGALALALGSLAVFRL